MTSTAARPPEDLELLSVQTVRFDERRAAVSVQGDLDVSTAAALWSILQSHLTAGRRYLRVDLSAVKFIDSCCQSLLVPVAGATNVIEALPALAIRLSGRPQNVELPRSNVTEYSPPGIVAKACVTPANGAPAW